MLHLQAAHQKNEWMGRMLVQVHDELLFEIPPSELLVTKTNQAPHGAGTPPVRPVVVDLKTGSNWSEMTAFKDVIPAASGRGSMVSPPTTAGMTINMAFEDLHRPLTSAGFRGAIKWIILISGGILILQQFVGSE